MGEAAEGDGISGDDTSEGAGTGDGGRGGAVVDLAGRYAEVAQRERTRRDGPAHVAGRDDVVAADAAVSAVAEDVTDANELTGADIGVGELTRAGGDDGLRTDQSGQRAGRDGGQGRAVIDLVADDRTRDGQRLRTDLHGAGRTGERVGDRRRRGRRRGEAGIVDESRRGEHVRAVRDGGTSQGDGRAVRRRGGQQGASETRGSVVDFGAGDVQREDGGVDIERPLGGDLVIGRQGPAADDTDGGLAEGALVIGAGGGRLGRAAGTEQSDRLSGQLTRGDRELVHGEQARAIKGLGAGQRQRLRGDRGLVADDRRRDDVVAEHRATARDHGSQRDARDVDTVGRDDVCGVISGGGTGREGDRVPGDESAGHGDIRDRETTRQRGRTVVDLRSGTERPQGQGERGDGRGDGGRTGDGVVGQLTARGGTGERPDRETAGDQGSRRRHVGAVEPHRRGAEGDDVAGEEITRRVGGDDGADEIGGTVVRLGDVRVGERDTDRPRRDADGGRRAHEGVVARPAGAVRETEAAEAAEAAGGDDAGAVRREVGAGDRQGLAGDAGGDHVGRRREDRGTIVHFAGRQTDGRRSDGDGSERGRKGVVRRTAGGAGDGNRTAGESAALIAADIRGAERGRASAQEDDLARKGAAHGELGRGDGGRGVVDLRAADRQRTRRDGHATRRTGEPVIGRETRTADQREGRGIEDDIAGFDVGRAG